MSIIGSAGTLQVQGGDFVAGSTGTFRQGTFSLKSTEAGTEGESVSTDWVRSVELVSREQPGGSPAVAVGIAVIGSLVVDPITAMTLASKVKPKPQVTFSARFEDGRRLLATTDDATYKQIARDVAESAETGRRRRARAAEFDARMEAEEARSSREAEEIVARFIASQRSEPSERSASAAALVPTGLEPVNRPTFGKRQLG